MSQAFPRLWVGVTTVGLLAMVLTIAVVSRSNYCWSWEASCDVDWPGWLQLAGVVLALGASLLAAWIPILHSQQGASKKQKALLKATSDALAIAHSTAQLPLSAFDAGPVPATSIATWVFGLDTVIDNLRSLPRFEIENQGARQRIELAITACEVTRFIVSHLDKTMTGLSITEDQRKALENNERTLSQFADLVAAMAEKARYAA